MERRFSGLMQINMFWDLAQKLNYKLFQAPKGFGKPVSEEKLEQQYREGTWDFLNTVDELANYMVVVGYIRYFAKDLKRPPKILDLGCGTGNIAELLSGYTYEKYLGLDISEEAVRQAQAKNLKNAEFCKAGFEARTPDETFDFIISTGAIHYAEKPWQVLQNYADSLNENGRFIISLWRYNPNRSIWRKIEENFEVIDSTVVKNHKGVTWDIKVLR